MLTVGKNVGDVERRPVEGRFCCPGCGGSLSPWGYGRRRVVFGLGWQGVPVRPRRARCSGCGVTHVLLPVNMLVRRRDEVGVIGAALVGWAAGRGHRRIAWALGRSVDTVRGWLRRFGGRAERVRAAFTAVQVAVDVDPPPLEPGGSAVAAAVIAIVAAAAAVGRRWPGVVAVWEVACAVTVGTLLAPAVTITAAVPVVPAPSPAGAAAAAAGTSNTNLSLPMAGW